jgi:hypothetical protein
MTMCFEWDERYRREEAIRLSKEKADELLKRATEAANADLENAVNQPVEREDVTA